MRHGEVAGIEKPVSRLVMGCDNQPNASHAAVMFDNYFEYGGNTFDTAHIYGGGRQEALLGGWLKNRGVREDVVVIGKGAHTPANFPDRVGPQLDITLDRLQTDYVDLYFLHRDNVDVPVDEWLDVLNAERKAGRIRVFGASNWSLARVQEANAHAGANGLTPFGAVSNNFSLARMVDPVWPGCIAASGCRVAGLAHGRADAAVTLVEPGPRLLHAPLRCGGRSRGLERGRRLRQSTERRRDAPLLVCR